MTDFPDARRSASLNSQLLEPPVGDALASVVRLPFRHVLTTNYDNLLDVAHRKLRPHDPMKVLRWEIPAERSLLLDTLGTAATTRFYVHLHGRADAPEHCVITEDDYRERYIRSQALPRLLYALFASQTVVFLGFSLSDPDFMAVIREVQAFGGGSRKHYALLPRPESEAGLTAYLRGKYGVFPILYANQSNCHEGLAPMLADLERLVSAPATDWASVNLSGPRRDGRANDPDDPNAGHFGGAAKRDGYELRLARVTNWDDRWATLELETTQDGRPPASPVAFHLHPTFPESVVRIQPSGHPCILRLNAWGAFTVGAIIGATGTRLELDLAQDPRLTEEFRKR